MVGRLILGLIWLTCVQSDSMPIEDASISKMSMTMPATDESSGVAASMSKTKRYLSHGHSSPCPPFYPHFGMHMPMYAMRPYGPPAYPKNNVHMPMYHEHHHHQPLQFIHQPSYTSYVPKQTVQYVKPAPPVYHHPIASPPVHHVQPIHPIVKHPPSYFHYQQPMIEHHKPMFAYAPAYNKPMPIWQGPEIKKIDYPIAQVSYHKPSIVYKPEAPKCAPCPQPPQYHQPQPPQYQHPQSSISYLKIAQPIVQQVHSPSKVYLPAPVHHPKPCDK